MKKVTAIIITIIILCAIVTVTAEVGDRGEFYPRLTVVIKKEQNIDTGLWVIYCQDRDGNMWAFYDDEGVWSVGDIANLLMWNVGKNEKEDEIIEAYWEGYTENPTGFFSLEGQCKYTAYILQIAK